MKKTDQRHYIDRVRKELGLTVDQLAAKMNYKSLKRAYWGDMVMSDSKIQHMEALLDAHRLETQARSAAPFYARDTPSDAGPQTASAAATTPQDDPSKWQRKTSEVLAILPVETLWETGQRLMASSPTEINFAAVREIIDELERRAVAARAAEEKLKTE